MRVAREFILESRPERWETWSYPSQVLWDLGALLVWAGMMVLAAFMLWGLVVIGLQIDVLLGI